MKERIEELEGKWNRGKVTKKFNLDVSKIYGVEVYEKFIKFLMMGSRDILLETTSEAEVQKVIKKIGIEPKKSKSSDLEKELKKKEESGA